MKKSKYEQYFYCFIVCVLVPYVFWFSYQQNVVTILISATFRGGALIRGETLIRVRHVFQCGYPKVRRLFEARDLLQETRLFLEHFSEAYSGLYQTSKMECFAKTISAPSQMFDRFLRCFPQLSKVFIASIISKSI